MCDQLLAQKKNQISIKHPKGQFFLFWGYNRSTYANSDIHLKGDNYDFIMHNVPARDLPENFTFDGYMSPSKITIPQFNARAGFFISDKYAITAGWDHTKYQTLNNAPVQITGTISAEASQKYEGDYNGETVLANHSDFIKIEHSDGLNLLQANIERHDVLITNKEESMGISTLIGIGIITPMPWTNARIFGVGNDDRPHFTGIGTSVSGGLKFHFLSRIFILAQGQAGFLHLPGIVLTPIGGSERASQNIKYLQGMLVFGYTFRLF